MLPSRPKAAMMAPPGTPGAATIVMPSMRMKPLNAAGSSGWPDMRRMAIAQAVIFIVLPERWIVAQRGTVKTAMLSRTPFLSACLSVTGMVAADDCVPNAVA